MIKFENTLTPSPEQWEMIINGVRNPKNSWEKSDSYAAVDCGKCGKIEREGICKKEDRDCTGYECFEIGPNDHDLMMRLRNAGTDHRKFMRMITVYATITAPLYWWKEFDTYKVGTVANSCSTMHKIAEKEFTLEDFSCEHLKNAFDVQIPYSSNITSIYHYKEILKDTIDILNNARALYLETKDKTFWWQMIQLLPSSYNQTRNVMMNYEVLANIYKSRKNHKLDEWIEFCQWIKELPYSELIIGSQETVIHQ